MTRAFFFILFVIAWCSRVVATDSLPQDSLPQIIHVEFDAKKVILLFDQEITKDIYKFFQLKTDDLKRDIYDFEAIVLQKNLSEKLKNGVQIKIAQNTPKKVRVVFSHKKNLKTTVEIKNKKMMIFAESESGQFTLLDQGNKKKPTLSHQPPPQKPKRNFRAHKTVVLDAGHGGKDCGAMGVAKVCEKVIALSLAKELEKELKKRGYKVYMTRASDIFIPLKNRTEIANAKNADIFISLHANAIQEEKRKSILRGIETYFLSPARSERAKAVAALENKEDIEEMNNFSRETVLGIISSQRLYASHRLAIDIQFGVLSALRGHYKANDGGVREGPFWVLAGALMPSILLEMGYITHPAEGKLINQSAYQKLLALGIANGIDGYFMKNF